MAVVVHLSIFWEKIWGGISVGFRLKRMEKGKRDGDEENGRYRSRCEEEEE